jgi:branched-chain amino acid transport system permease protein
MDEYIINILVYIEIYLILAMSLNLLFGFGGLLNLAHMSTCAIGAYTTALLSTGLQYDPLNISLAPQGVWVCIPASMILCAFSALLIGAISLRLSEDYFAIGTLAFSSVVLALLINWKSLTHGVLGITGIPAPEIGQIDFYDRGNFLKFSTIITIITLLFFNFVNKSRLARNLIALAENEQSALSLGKKSSAIRNDAFIISAAFSGLAGSLFAYYIQYVDPSSFTLSEMVFVLSIVIVGKPGSFWGVIAGTVFLVILPEPLRFLEISSEIVGPMRQLLYALILFAVVYVKKEKLFLVERKI